MKVQCSQCNTLYRIDKRRLQTERKSKARCIKCDNVINLDLPGNRSEFAFDWQKLLPEKALYGKDLKSEITGNFKKLYPMPHVMWKARRLISDPNSDFKQISRILRTDQALASRILKIANSAYFGLKGKVSSIQHATVLLGSKLLTQIISMVGHSKMLGGTLNGYGMDSGNAWRHSLTVAVGSDIIAKKIAPEYNQEAFLSGLLHDAGKILLDPYIMERQDAFNAVTERMDISSWDAEKKVLGTDHAEIGNQLCIHWNFPDFVADAIRWHHHPSGSKANLLAYIIHSADIIANGTNSASFEADTLVAVNRNTLKFLRLNEAAIQAVAYEIFDAVETLEDDTY